ncbi:HTH-type transcriptional regulator HexR [Klebsiella pneumoniae]|nr:HTH-type transcriptional regulator HexR [Klebsiella pneumoniae]
MANNPTQLTILQDEIRRRYDTLSKRLKQVARYILDNSNSVAFDTVASIAQQADVPPSTLIRFANAFGFSGFNEMKQMFKQHLMEETANYTERARLFRQTTSDESSPPETPTEILNMFTMVNNQALQQLAMQTSSDDLERAVALLGEAENIYVIGLRRSFSVASYLTCAASPRSQSLSDRRPRRHVHRAAEPGRSERRGSGGELLAVRPGSGRAGGAGRAAQSAADRHYRQPGQPAGGFQRCLLCGA